MPPIAVFQIGIYWLVHRHREQAPAHTDIYRTKQQVKS